MISADKVGATLLGYPPETVPHIALSAANCKRPGDLSDITIMSDQAIEDLVKPHHHLRERGRSGDVPQLFETFGIQGIRFPEADSTLCTYCVPFFAYALVGLLMSPSNREPFDNIEILSGKILEPDGNHKHTLLLGQCQVKLNQNHPKIQVICSGCPLKLFLFLGGC